MCLSTSRIRDYVPLAPVPLSEPCEQVGPRFRRNYAATECSAYSSQLLAEFPAPCTCIAYRVIWNSHDFGSYPEVRIVFREGCDVAYEYALKVERNEPEHWDNAGRAALIAAIPDYFTTRCEV